MMTHPSSGPSGEGTSMRPSEIREGPTATATHPVLAGRIELPVALERPLELQDRRPRYGAPTSLDRPGPRHVSSDGAHARSPLFSDGAPPRREARNGAAQGLH